MDTRDALRAATSLLVGTPTSFLPPFLAASGAALVPQVFVLLGVGAAYAWLLAAGRIEPFVSALSDLLAEIRQNPEGGARPGSGVDEAVARQFREATLALFTPEVVAILAVTAVVAVAVGVLVRGIVVAGRAHTAVSVVFGDRPVEDGVRGAARDWRSYVGYVLLRLVVLLGPTLAFGAAVGGAALADPLLGVAVLLVGGLVWLVVVSVAYLLVAFVPQAIAVEGVGVSGGVRYAARFVRAEPRRALTYVGVAVGVWVLVGLVSGLLSVVGVDRVLGVIAVVVVGPWLGLVKTALYVDVEPPAVEAGPAWPRFRAAFGRGLRELRTFVVGHPGTQAACGAVFAAGGVAGYLATAPLSLGLPAPEDPASVFGQFPVSDAVTIAANNWLVAVSQTFAGLAFGVPVISNLTFNGLLVGAVMGIGFELPVAVALVAPHAVVEIPALVVSGAVGLHLGRHAWGYLYGGVDAAGLAAEMRRALFVLLGLAPVFVVAAVIEAFVTPLFVTLVG